MRVGGLAGVKAGAEGSVGGCWPLVVFVQPGGRDGWASRVAHTSVIHLEQHSFVTPALNPRKAWKGVYVCVCVCVCMCVGVCVEHRQTYIQTDRHGGGEEW